MATPKAIASASSTPAASGAFYVDSKGKSNANGYLKLKLAVPTGSTASLIGGGEVAASEIIRITLDANGVPSANQTMFMSDQFSSPVNPSFYIEIHDANDRTVATIQNAVIAGTAPVDLTNLTVTGNGVSYSGSVLLAPSAQQKITAFPLELAKSLVLDGATSGNTTLQAATAASGTVTLPAATDTLVGKATTDTLSNKTLTSPVITNPTSTGTDNGAEILQQKTLQGAASGNAITLLNSQDPLTAVTGNGTDQTLYTFTIPANTVAAGKGFRLRAFALSNNPVAVTYKLIVGATTVFTIPNGSAAENDVYNLEVFNNAATQAAQTAILSATVGATVVTSSLTTLAENFANAITVKITANEVAANTVTPKKWFIELIQ